MPPDAKRDQIAAAIRERITNGIYAAGAPLPSETALAQEFNVARNTVKEALYELRMEGLLHTIPRRGTYVQPPRPRRRLQVSRYQSELDQALADLESALDPTGLPAASVGRVNADQTLADLFGVPVGTRLLRREWVTVDGGYPTQLTTSYLPTELVGSTTGRLRSAGGVIAYLVSVGRQPTRVVESTVARPPTDHESDALRVGSGWVLATTRRIFCGGEVVEVGHEIVVPAQGTEIVNEVDLR